MTWRAIARSSIGTSHKKRQLPCQDYGQYIIADDVVIGAVSDGAGSAKYADEGAELAVKTALSSIEQWLRSQTELKPVSEEQARDLFSQILENVILALKAAAASRGYSWNDLACTLLIFIATPDWITAMQVGDGFILVGLQGEYQLLFQPSKGEFINETAFVTAPNALDEMQVCVRVGSQEFICVATDGLEKVAIQIRDWVPFTPFFQPLADYMRTTSDPEQEDEYILDFLDSARLNLRTDDDKTLLLCLYDASELREQSSEPS